MTFGLLFNIEMYWTIVRIIIELYSEKPCPSISTTANWNLVLTVVQKQPKSFRGITERTTIGLPSTKPRSAEDVPSQQIIKPLVLIAVQINNKEAKF